MEYLTSKTVAVLSRPFSVPGFDERLPAGEYQIETELFSHPDHQNPSSWKSSVLIKLHPRKSRLGLARSQTISLADLEHARARDKLAGVALSDFFLDEMMADPMVRLVMQSDGVSEAHLRNLYSGLQASQPNSDALEPSLRTGATKKYSSIQDAENEEMPARP